jgi:hypothetical protein
MARSISIVKRATNVVDLCLVSRPNVVSYNIFAASGFDQTFTKFASVPAFTGLRSPTVACQGMVASQYRGRTRFLFNPNDYTTVVPAVIDSSPFFVQIQQVNADGTTGPIEAMHLILPYSTVQNRVFVLHGNVPAGATIANSLEIQLPMVCCDFEFQDDGSTVIHVAFSPTDGEFVVNQLNFEFTNYRHVKSSSSQVFLRSDGAPSLISMSFALLNNQ